LNVEDFVRREKSAGSWKFIMPARYLRCTIFAPSDYIMTPVFKNHIQTRLETKRQR